MADNVTLLVEDHPDGRRLIARALRQQGGGIDLATASVEVDLIEYLRGLSQSGPMARLILFNLSAARPDALELIRQIRAVTPGRLPPIVVMAPDADDRFRTTAYNSGANSCVRKPLDPEKLSETIQHIVRYWTTLNVLPEALGPP